MDNNFSGNWNWPDDPRLQEAISRAEKVAKAWKESMQRVQEALRPLIEAIEENKKKMAEVGPELAKVAKRASRSLEAVEKMGDAQFVYWDYMTSKYVDDVVSSDNLNKTLWQYVIHDKFQRVNATIDNSCNMNAMKKRRRLYIQAVRAFQNGDSDLAVTGFTSVKNSTSRLQPRIDVIKEKLKTDVVLDHDEYAMLTLALTFEKTLDSFCAFSDFKRKEPKGLNRHWIAHGRSTRKKTKLDCVKMINLIYGLLLIAEFDTKEEGETNE